MLLLFAPLVIDEPFAASFYRAMAVLVAAVLRVGDSTPSAVLSGVARGARSGVLFKGGGHLSGSVVSTLLRSTKRDADGRGTKTDRR